MSADKKTLRIALVTTVIGWITGIATFMLNEHWRMLQQQREVASMLLVEVRDNYKRLTSFAQASNLDNFPKGSVVMVTAAEVQTNRFEATLTRQGVLPVEIIKDLEDYYADIRIVIDEEKHFDKQTRLFATSVAARQIAERLIPRLQAIATSKNWF